jgi:K+ transporter
MHMMESNMGYLIALIALVLPRVVLFTAFLATDWIERAYETRLWPLMGFLLMPYTTLAYMAAMMNNNHALTGGWLALFVAAVAFDVIHWGNGGREYHRRSRSRNT